MTRTGTRYCGKYFTFGNVDAPYNFVNHSFKPNLLCHCGVVLARRDIPAGEEMTLDYRTLIDTTDVGLYNDAVTGREIRGHSARETLRVRNGAFSGRVTGLSRGVGGNDAWTGHFSWRVSGRFTAHEVASATVSGSVIVRSKGRAVSRCDISRPAKARLRG